MNKLFKTSFLILVLGLFLVLITGKFVFAEGPKEEEIKTVRIGVLPYFDCMHLVGAKSLGMDKELGLDLEFTFFTSQPNAVRAMVRGELDVIEGALISIIPLYPEVQDLRVFFTNNQFKGFVVVGREGEYKTFEEFLEEKNGDFRAAQIAVLMQMKGSTFNIIKVTAGAALAGMLEQAGMTLDDVKINDFADPIAASNAFVRGEGDFTFGSLPITIKLLKLGYIGIAGNEVWGPGGLWFSDTYTLQKYAEKNPEVLTKLNAIHYRLVRYINEKQDVIFPILVDYINEHAATGLTFEDANLMCSTFLDFYTLETAKERVYNPDSPIYWKIAFDYYVEQNMAGGVISKDSHPEEMAIMEETYNRLLRDKDLLRWIKSPI